MPWVERLHKQSCKKAILFSTKQQKPTLASMDINTVARARKRLTSLLEFCHQVINDTVEEDSTNANEATNEFEWIKTLS